jgi:hypothetical protein
MRRREFITLLGGLAATKSATEHMGKIVPEAETVRDAPYPTSSE